MPVLQPSAQNLLVYILLRILYIPFFLLCNYRNIKPCISFQLGYCKKIDIQIDQVLSCKTKPM
jgi:hypothetical protein